MPHDAGAVLRDLAAHPVDRLLRRWNWKTAALTATLRGAIFFGSHLSAGLGTALEVLGRDLLFRVPLGGFYGAISQAFRHARPPWAAYVVVMIVVPATAHVAEFVVHWLGGTPRLKEAVTTSIAFSAFSALFNLFLMRRGVLVTGAAAGSLRDDVGQIPRLVLEFATWIVLTPWRVLRRWARAR